MGRINRVKAHKKKEIEIAVKWIVFPPAIATALLLGTGKKKRRKRK